MGSVIVLENSRWKNEQGNYSGRISSMLKFFIPEILHLISTNVCGETSLAHDNLLDVEMLS